MAVEQTFVFIKPDGLKRNLTGNIITKISNETNLDFVGAKIVRVSRELAAVHYAHLKDNKEIYEGTIKFVMGLFHDEGKKDREAGWEHYRRKVLAIVYYGDDAVEKLRGLCGKTNPLEADPTSIRGAYGRIAKDGIYENVIHASKNITEAKREIKMWFKPQELITLPENLPGFEVENSTSYYLLLGDQLNCIGLNFSPDGKSTYFAIEGNLYLVDKGDVFIFQNVAIKNQNLTLSVLEETVNKNIDKPTSQCGKIIAPSHELMWKSDLRALEELLKNPEEAKLPLDAVMAKYLVHSELYKEMD
ncbi:nucleoside-diphosphate kinase [Candidatus Woesearchaeota archaeon]|nr:nucleoside-diphosphate kinase [Candidatus Woesearchaeota archaeon]